MCGQISMTISAIHELYLFIREIQDKACRTWIELICVIFIVICVLSCHRAWRPSGCLYLTTGNIFRSQTFFPLIDLALLDISIIIFCITCLAASSTDQWDFFFSQKWSQSWTHSPTVLSDPKCTNWLDGCPFCKRCCVIKLYRTYLAFIRRLILQRLESAINLLKPAIYFTYHQVLHSKNLHVNYIAFMCFVWLSEQTVTFALYIINRLNLTFLGPCIANIFSEYNQRDATFLNLFISIRRSTCFRWFSRPSSGAQKLHIQRQAFVRPLVLPAAEQQVALMVWQMPDAVCAVFELLMMDGKTIWNM